MMRLSIMRDLITAESTQAMLAEVLGKWGYDKDSIQFIRASSNFLYTFTSNEQKYVARLTDTRDRTYSEVEVELFYLSYLAGQQVPVNTPCPSKSGNVIEVCESELGTFNTVVFPFIQGVMYEVDDLAEADFFQWGKSLGRLHKYSQQYNPSTEGAKPFSYEKHLQFIKKMIIEEDSYIQQELEAIETWMLHLPKTEENYGVIHFDFELDNLIWTEGQFEIIDFEHCSYYWYTADIAFALRDLFETGFDAAHPHFQSFLKGYKEEKNISGNYAEEIPMFLRFHQLFILATLLKTLDVNVEVEQQNPEWVVNLANRLDQKVKGYRSMLRQKCNS